MKNLLFLLFMVFSLGLFAQLDVKPNYTKPYFQGSVKIADTLEVPYSAFGGSLISNSIATFEFDGATSLTPLSFYENKVGGAINGDNYSLDFYFNDSNGSKTLGGSIFTRVDGTPTVGNVNMSMSLNSMLKLQANERVLVTPNPNTLSAIAQFEVRGTATTTNTVTLFKSGLSTGSQILLLLQNSNNKNLLYVDAMGKLFHNPSKISTGDFQISSLNNTSLFYSDASVDAIGIGSKTINNSAILDITSTTKGFLPPRMTTAQRDAIVSPTAGLQVYNTTTNTPQFYNGSIWGNI